MNEATFQLLLGGVLGLGLLTIVPAALVASRLHRILERRHPQVWRDLGSPRFGPVPMGRSARLREFITSRSYQSLGDAEFDRLVRIGRIAERIATASIGIFLVLLVASWFV